MNFRIAFICLFTTFFVQGQDYEFVHCNKHLSSEMLKEAQAIQAKGPQDDYDIFYHRLEWTVDPAKIYIAGKVTTYFTAEKNNLNQLLMDLSDSLSVSEIRQNGQVLAYAHNNDKLFIDLSANLSLGAKDSITITYEGKPKSSGLGSFQIGIHGQDDVPVLWTLSEPYGAKDWWPCKQTLSDKIDSIDIIVTTPKKYKTASLGLLKGEKVVGLDKVMHWQHKYPVVTYLIAIAVTDYLVMVDTLYSQDLQEIRLEHYVYQEDSLGWRNTLGITNACMTFFSDSLGSYPFKEEKYGHAQWGAGGGMEHQTMSFMGGFQPMLIGHELAHQWVGNKITCATWNEIWLNEGFATYLAALVDERYFPETFENFKRYTTASIKTSNDGSVYVYSTQNVPNIFDGRLVYQKGAYLLHMLRWKVGDKAFFEGLRNYMNAPNLIYSFAQSIEFQQHIEATSGMDLTEFFEDWLYGEGFPIYSIEAYQNGGRVGLKISQNTSDNSVDFFEMPLEIGFYGEGQDTLVRFDQTKNNQNFGVELPFKLDSIKVDPRLWLVSKTDSIKINKRTDFVDIYPNPAKDVVTINSAEKILELKVYDLNGKLMLTRNPSALIDKFSVTGLSQGRYLCKITTSIRELTLPLDKN
jgi:aminopeptidase N